MILIDLSFAAFLATVGLGVGRRVLDALGQSPEHPVDAIALATPMGLGLLSLGVLTLGTLGWLTPVGLAVLLAVAIELGFLRAIRTLGDAWKRMIPPQADADQPPLIAARVVAICLALGLLGTAAVATAPVTDGDALCYHLQVPKVFLNAHAAGFDPDLHETVYPLSTELLYAIALEFRGPVACRWIQWFLGLTLAASVTAMARPSLNHRAWWAGAIVLLAPAISNGMSAPLNDVALAAFGAAAILAWTRLLDRPSDGSAIVAGLLAGLAAGVKYPALVLIALMGGWLLLKSLRGSGRTGRSTADDRSLSRKPGKPARRSGSPPDSGAICQAESRTHESGDVPFGSDAQTSWPRLAAIYATAAILAGGGWYWRAFIYTGNPVYPFFRQMFGGAGLDEVLDPIKRPMAVTAWNLLTGLVPLTIHPDRFDSFSHQFGPVFLLFLPVALLERPGRRVLGLAVLGYLFLMLCLTQRQSMRFVLIALAPMSVTVAHGLSAWCDRRSLPSRLVAAMLLIVLGLEAGLAVARARHVASVLAGRESSESFLARREPTFEVGRWASANLPAGARLIGQDHRGFYIPRPYTMELAHRRRTGLGRRGERPDQIVERLRSEGFTHLMLCPPVPENAVEFDPTLGRLLAPWLAHRQPVYRRDLTDGDGVRRRYAIYTLTDDRVASRPPGGTTR